MEGANLFVLAQRVVAVTEVVVADALLEHLDLGDLSLLLLVSKSYWLNIGHRVDRVILRPFSDTMAPMLTVELFLHVLRGEVTHAV